MSTESAFIPIPTQQTLTARRIVSHWDETPYDELNDGPKLTRARVCNRYEGDLDGESWEEYLMLYPGPQSGSFVSLERFIGCLGEQQGSFVLQGVGTYANGVARGRLTIIPGSGTGELTGLRGEGDFIAAGGRCSTVTLTYAFST